MTDKPRNTDIRVRDLTLAFSRAPGPAIRDISLNFPGRRITGIIGESGSGKSVLGMSLISLLPQGTRVRGEITLGGRNIRNLSPRGLRRLRKTQIALIPQDPAAALDPAMGVGAQIREGLGRDRESRVRDILARLHLSGRDRQRPFQFSGGMRQRALVAMGLARNPAWLLADEPTKGLDPRLRYQMAGLLRSVYDQTRTGIILISHDLPFARRLCHYTVVLYCGRILETGPSGALFSTPLHPYTRALLRALPENGFIPVPGPAPDPAQPPAGCPFHPRCPDRRAICTREFPRGHRPGNQREIYCHAQG